MGLIAAALGAAGGVLADQWKEYFYCESIPNDILVVKGHKKVSGRSTNTKGSDNVITNGSLIAVADGQCMVIVEQGKVVDFCAQPGEYKYDISLEPSLFDGGKLGANILAVFKNIGKRFTFGGETPMDQRVYYFNIKEITGNKYGTPSPVPFRVVDQRAGIDIDISIRCFGEYSYRVTNPILFYTNVCGNVPERYERGQIDGQMKSELLTALQPAFAKISEMGIRYSALPGHTAEMASAMNEVLSAKWRDLRGIEIISMGVSSVKASEEDEAMIKEMQRNAAYANPNLAAATLAGAQAAAMRDAANNAGGASVGFMNMNMAAQAGGLNAASLYQMSQQQTATAPQVAAGDRWTCPKCGAQAVGKFCTECGTKKPEAAGWTCRKCGTVNQGKFCMECGEKKPAGVPQYRCDKCGWLPPDPTRPPKFCPECGDPFDDGDLT